MNQRPAQGPGATAVIDDVFSPDQDHALEVVVAVPVKVTIDNQQTPGGLAVGIAGRHITLLLLSRPEGTAAAIIFHIAVVRVFGKIHKGGYLRKLLITVLHGLNQLIIDGRMVPLVIGRERDLLHITGVLNRDRVAFVIVPHSGDGERSAVGMAETFYVAEQRDGVEIRKAGAEIVLQHKQGDRLTDGNNSLVIGNGPHGQDIADAADPGVAVVALDIPGAGIGAQYLAIELAIIPEAAPAKSVQIRQREAADADEILRAFQVTP